MRNEIPLKLRCLAFLLHLIGGSIATSAIILITMYVFSSNRIISDLLVFIPALIPLTIFVSPFLAATIWVGTKDIHPFMNQAGRDAINCLLNTVVGMLLSILLTVFVFSVTCGIGNQDPRPFFLSFIPFALIAITYFFNSIVSAIFAIQGYRLNSRLIYPFIKPI
jgi:uncharacterized Tic20 family protein